MLENLKTIYSPGGGKPRPYGIRLVTCFGLAGAGYLLFQITGGFPPKTWGLLFDVLPRLQSLWVTNGPGVLLPLTGLFLFSFSLLVLWGVIILGISHSIVHLWPAQRRQQTVLHENAWSLDEPPSPPHSQLASTRSIEPTQPELYYQPETDTSDPLIPSRPFTYNLPAQASKWNENRVETCEEEDASLPAPTSYQAELRQPTQQSFAQQQAQLAAQSRQFQPPLQQQIQPLLGAIPAYDPPPQNRGVRTHHTGTSHGHLRLVPDQAEPEQPFSVNEEYEFEQTQPLPEEEDIEELEPDTRPLEDDGRSVGISQAPTAPHRNWIEEDDEQEATLRLVIGIGLDPGLVRKDRPNEDSLFAIQGIRTTEDGPVPAGLFVVADGMGGHANGRDASRLAVHEISNIIVPTLLNGDGNDNWDADDEEEFMLNLLKDGVDRANLAIHQQNRNTPHMMGTTITTALIVNTTAFVINVGDSRTYLYRASEGLVQITQDHSIVARLVEQGEITRDEIYTHPQRNQIYRCLGEHPTVEMDAFVVPLQPDDILLLCSDGLWEMVRDPVIEKIITSTSHLPAQISDILVQAALNGGGADNISVIAVGIVETTL
jgi:serine/threonine protein phosphatase PrpC